MGSTHMDQHPEPRMHLRLQIPGALQRVPRERVLLAAYPVGKPGVIPQPGIVPQPASNQQSDFDGSALSFWQTSPMAFAQHLEEP